MIVVCYIYAVFLVYVSLMSACDIYFVCVGVSVVSVTLYCRCLI